MSAPTLAGYLEHHRWVGTNRLRREGLIGGMIADALSVSDMTPTELISCLMSEPYNLDPTEENLKEITRIVNGYKNFFEVKFLRSRGGFNMETVLSI